MLIMNIIFYFIYDINNLYICALTYVLMDFFVINKFIWLYIQLQFELSDGLLTIFNVPVSSFDKIPLAHWLH